MLKKSKGNNRRRKTARRTETVGIGMSDRTAAVSFYKPQMEDLWFRQAMLADPETMAYNHAWGGTIAFPQEDWEDWYDTWVGSPDKRFYRYITSGRSRAFVGEAAWHFDEEAGIYLADVIITARCRHQGYGKAGLELLCRAAQKAKLPALYDNLAGDNLAKDLFLQCGLTEESRTDEIILLKKTLEEA